MPSFIMYDGMLPSILYQTNATSTSALTTYTFSSQATGTASASRTVIIGAAGVIGNAGGSITGVTIDGNAATALVNLAQAAGASFRGAVGIFALAVPTGTASTIAVTFNTAFVRAAIGVWSAYDLSSLTPTATATAATSTSGQALGLNLNVLAGGLVVGMGFDAGNNGTFPTPVWVGASSRFTAGPAGDTNSGADYTATAAETPRTLSCTFTTSSQGAAVAASLR